MSEMRRDNGDQHDVPDIMTLREQIASVRRSIQDGAVRLWLSESRSFEDSSQDCPPLTAND